MRRSVIMIGILICAVGLFIGIISTFFYSDILSQYIGSSHVDLLRIISIFGFLSFFVGFLLSIVGAVSKRKIFKKTKLISFNRYYNP